MFPTTELAVETTSSSASFYYDRADAMEVTVVTDASAASNDECDEIDMADFQAETLLYLAIHHNVDAVRNLRLA